MSQLWVKDIQPKIREELNKRKKYLSYNFDEGSEIDINYQKWNAKTPWITVYSNVLEKIPGEKTTWVKADESEKTKIWGDQEKDYTNELASNSTFRGLLSTKDGDRETFDEIYKNDLSDPYALRPVPTLESLSVENIDSYGAVRKAVISFVCYTLQQLENMEKLYMSPGASIVAQWGWNVIESQVEEETFGKKHKLYAPDGAGPKYIKEKVISSGGNYGAFLGTITKFTWDIQEDGSVSCTTEAVSRGYAELFENIKENTKTLFDDEDAKTFVDVLDGIDNDDYKEGKEEEIANKLKPLFRDQKNSGDATEYNGKKYLSIKFIFNLLNFFYSKDAGEVFKNVNIQESEVLTSGGSYNKIIEVPVLIGNRTESPILRSLDRDIFIIPKEDSVTKIKLADEDGYWGRVIPTGKWWIFWNSYAGSDSTGSDNGPIDSILVELSVIKSAFQNANTYKDGVKNILAQLNQFSNNFWDLALENDETGFVRIVDRNYDPSTLPKENDSNIVDSVYEFPTFGQYSMAQSVTVSAALPDQMKNAAAYSGVGSQGSKIKSGFRALYGDIRDHCNKSFGGKTLYPKIQGTGSTKKVAKDMDAATKFIKKGAYLRKVKIISEYWTYISTQWGLAENGNTGYTSPSLIPLDLSLTIDGIEGLQYGNVITVDYLPARYRNYSAFIITSISHNISRDGWTTSLGTQFRVASIKTTEKSNNPYAGYEEYLKSVKV